MKKKAGTKKPYRQPTLTQLTPEEARLRLAPYVEKGDEGAKKLMQSVPGKDSTTRKKSA
jgi:hypothetical protein